MLNFASDYTQGAHPAILQALQETNLEATAGYGTDEYCEHAREKLRAACECPNAAVYFISGGTQANLTVLAALLQSWQGVIAADTGHVSGHEAGAVELTGHKVITLPHENGKLTAAAVKAFCAAFFADENRAHMTSPGAVYVSFPTEYGTLYSLSELTALRGVCDTYGLKLYLDGARLAYALGAEQNDVTLPDLARLCHVFYVGGTKCGALLGEAVVIPDKNLLPRFFTQMKQHGAVLAKGRVLGLQFDALFTDGLYEALGKNGVEKAERLEKALLAAGFTAHCPRETNQVFLRLTNEQYHEISKKVTVSFWEQPDPAHTAVRLAASWATTQKEVEAVVEAFISTKG